MTINPKTLAKIGALAGFVLICSTCLPDASALAREAGWVPLEPATGIVKQKLPVSGYPSASSSKRTAPKKEPVKVDSTPLPPGVSVYDGQPPVNEKELYEFLELLPRFRAWARKQGEEAHPVLGKNGKPDFLYSPTAAQWVAANGFVPPRFFCVMGRMAAALAIVEEGNDSASSRPADMPMVDPKELALARKHLGELLSAGGPPGPIK